MSTDFIVGDFAGAGGADQATRIAGFAGRVVGVEQNPAAAATAVAAGHERVVGDCREVTIPLIVKLRAEYGPTARFGYKAGPPCQTFSAAGGGTGRRALDHLTAAAWLVSHEQLTPAEAIAQVHDEALDERSVLALHPLHVIVQTFPNWIFLEQVPQVLPLWEAYAELLADHGYKIRTGIANSEQYGVPQTRKRAILIASHDSDVVWPEPTHSKYHARTPDRLDQGVLPWVSWGQALGSNYGTGGDARNRGGWASRQPAAAVTSKIDRNKVKFGDVRQAHGAVRDEDRPAPTITASADNGNFRFITPPDYQVTGSTRLTPQQAGILQSFPADYPWQGNSGEQYLQVGNAAPPLLGAAFMRQLL